MGKSDGAAKNDNDGATVKKESLSWTDQMDAAFIEALLSEQNAGNRPNGTFSSTAYNNIVKALNEKFNVTFEKEKLKNRIKTLKKYFNQFHDVFKGVALSGYSWNPSTLLIEAEDEVWEALKKDNPGVYELKNKQVKCYEQMYALWAKDRATGTSSFTAKEKRKQLNNDKQSETVEVEDPNLESDTFCENNGVTLDSFDTSDDIQFTSPPPQQAKIPIKSKSKKRKADEEDPIRSKIADSLDNIVHALDRNSKVIESSRPHVYTEKEIYEELQCMGLSKEDIQPAYAFLLEHPVQTRGLFGCPFEAREEFLKTVMGIDK
ncbi:myb/SANT-like domain-containing protein [Artemisia annua]|uniref:Myb/SANT-like domain-containing protein n=1 Tax=Artemisia annua TaxID=35608 RepID=A0A2U1LHQ0_ARTAN|nr:myb/SANT-like domain-containing protein [Artemisia annua]